MNDQRSTLAETARSKSFTLLFALGLLGSSGAASAALITFTNESAFLSALGGTPDATMDFEGFATATPANDLVHVSSPFTQNGVSFTDTSLIIHETFNDSSSTSGRYNIGADDTNNSVGHNNPASPNSSRTATVSHSSNSIFASGMTFFTVRNDATHSPGTVIFNVGGQDFDFTTTNDTGNLTTAGSSQFFGFISDIALTSYSVETVGNTSGTDKQYLITDNIHVHTRAVPVPPTLLLLLTGCLGLLASRRRRRDLTLT